ncbi:MAG: hypothetical protein ABJE95_10760 [Byssovorax sp.]
MNTKKILGASILTLAFSATGCIGSDSEIAGDTVDNTEDAVGATQVLTTLGGVLTQGDKTNQALKSENLVAVLAGLAGFASLIPKASSYAEISPGQIQQISTQTANQVVAQIQKDEMNTYLANSKTDLDDAGKQIKGGFSCTPGAPVVQGGKLIPHCSQAQLTNAHGTAEHLFIELENDWSDLTTLSKASPALAMIAAKSIILVGAARIFLDHRLQIIDQMTNQEALYQSTPASKKHNFKVHFTQFTKQYNNDLKAEMGYLNSQFEPALDGVFTAKVVEKVQSASHKTRSGCAYDQSNNETCDTDPNHTDEWDCDPDFGCSWYNSPPADQISGYADAVKKGLTDNIRSAKQAEWLGIGAGFWNQYNSL